VDIENQYYNSKGAARGRAGWAALGRRARAVCAARQRVACARAVARPGRAPAGGPAAPAGGRGRARPPAPRARASGRRPPGPAPLAPRGVARPADAPAPPTRPGAPQACSRATTRGRRWRGSGRWFRWRAKRASGELLVAGGGAALVERVTAGLSARWRARCVTATPDQPPPPRSSAAAAAAAGASTRLASPRLAPTAAAAAAPPSPPPRGFKALKQIVKLYYKMGQPDKMMEAYRRVVGGGQGWGPRSSRRGWAVRVGAPAPAVEQAVAPPPRLQILKRPRAPRRLLTRNPPQADAVLCGLRRGDAQRV
jgi:hypothetical protein